MYFYAVIVITITTCIVIAIVIIRKKSNRQSHRPNAAGINMNPLYDHNKGEGIYEEPDKKCRL